MKAKAYELTAEDGFFITFLTAYMGARIQYWKSTSNQFEIIVILATIIAFTTLVCRIRYMITNKSLAHGIQDIGGIFILMYAYFYFKSEASYFQSSDKHVFLWIAIIWVTFPVFVKIANWLEFSPKKTGTKE